MTTIELPREHKQRTFRISRPEISGVLRVRAIGACLGLAVFCAFAFAVSVAIGDYPISVQDVVPAMFGLGDEGTVFIVKELRLPRALVAVLAGAAFGISGAVFQTLTRNPLASPDMIGLTSGATTAAVAGVVLGIGSTLGAPAMGLLGGLATAVVIYLLAWKRGTTGYRIVLIGIGVSWMCASATSYLLVKADLWEAQQVMRWLVGSLNASDWVHVQPLCVALVALVPCVLLLSRWMRLLQFGDDLATNLGVPVRWAQFALIFSAVGLISVATAVTGPIAFVALTAPQIAQRLSGLAWPPVVASALTGSAIVLASDLLARQVLPGILLPVGVVTGVLGGVFLLWLLTRANRLGSGG